MYLTENRSIFLFRLICSKNRISPRLSEFGSKQLYFRSCADDEKSYVGTSTHFLDVRFGFYGAFYPRKPIGCVFWWCCMLCNKTTFHIIEYAAFWIIHPKTKICWSKRSNSWMRWVLLASLGIFVFYIPRPFYWAARFRWQSLSHGLTAVLEKV